MPAGETLIVEVGSAIAKALLKLWLKDAGLASDISSSLVDILKKKTSDRVAQNRGQRQFEDIGESVATSLLPLIEIEYSRLDEPSKNAVILASAESLVSAKITPELLIKNNLDPYELFDCVMRTRPQVTQYFSQDEMELYRRLLSETSRYIVDIASRLPTFTERTFLEILKQQDQILGVVRYILEEVQRISESSQQVNTDEGAARFETNYCLAVLRHLNQLELFGADISEPSRRQNLSVAYVSLNAIRKAGEPITGEDSAFGTIASAVRAEDYWDEEEGEIPTGIEEEQIPVEELLKGARRFPC